MALRTQAELVVEISSLLADNNAGSISAADVRSIFTDAIESLAFRTAIPTSLAASLDLGIATLQVGSRFNFTAPTGYTPGSWKTEGELVQFQIGTVDSPDDTDVIIRVGLDDYELTEASGRVVALHELADDTQYLALGKGSTLTLMGPSAAEIVDITQSGLPAPDADTEGKLYLDRSIPAAYMIHETFTTRMLPTGAFNTYANTNYVSARGSDPGAGDGYTDTNTQTHPNSGHFYWNWGDHLFRVWQRYFYQTTFGTDTYGWHWRNAHNVGNLLGGSTGVYIGYTDTDLNLIERIPFPIDSTRRYIGVTLNNQGSQIIRVRELANTTYVAPVDPQPQYDFVTVGLYGPTPAGGQTAAQVQAAIQAAINALIDGAPSDRNTLDELSDALDAAITALVGGAPSNRDTLGELSAALDALPSGLTEAEVDARVELGVADWAEEGNASDIPDSKIPDGVARDSEVADSFTGASETGGTLTLTRRNGSNPVDVPVGGAGTADGTLLYGSGAPPSTLGKDGDSYFDNTAQALYSKASGTWTLETTITGVGSGLNEAQVDARVAFGVDDWAETGDTSDIPESKIPDAIARDSEVADSFTVASETGGTLTLSRRSGSNPVDIGVGGTGLDEGEVDARVAVGVADWAEEGNADLVPVAKLAPDGLPNEVLTRTAAGKVWQPLTFVAIPAANVSLIGGDVNEYAITTGKLFTSLPHGQRLFFTTLASNTGGVFVTIDSAPRVEVTKSRYDSTQANRHLASSMSPDDLSANDPIFVTYDEITDRLVWTPARSGNAGLLDVGTNLDNLVPLSAGGVFEDSVIPDGIARDSEVADSFTGASEAGGTMTLSRRSGSNPVDINVGGGTADGTLLYGDGAPDNADGADGDSYYDRTAQALYSKDSGTWTLEATITGAGSGLTQMQVDARVAFGVADWAETGDTSIIPAAKLPASATEGLNQGEVDARVALGVEDWAETGDTSEIPATKLPGSETYPVSTTYDAANDLLEFTSIAGTIPQQFDELLFAFPSNIGSNTVPLRSSLNGGTAMAMVDANSDPISAADVRAGSVGLIYIGNLNFLAMIPQVAGWATYGNGDRLPTGKLGSGTADATTFLRGDGAWETPAGGGADTSNGRVFNIPPSGVSQITPSLIELTTGYSLSSLEAGDMFVFVSERDVDAQPRVDIDSASGAEVRRADDGGGLTRIGDGEISDGDLVLFVCYDGDDLLHINPRQGLAAGYNVGTAEDQLAALNSNGRFDAARLGSGTADATTYLRGDGAWEPADDAYDWATEGDASLVPTGKLGTGTPTSSSYLRGDGSWDVITGGTAATWAEAGNADLIPFAKLRGRVIPCTSAIGVGDPNTLTLTNADYAGALANGDTLIFVPTTGASNANSFTVDFGSESTWPLQDAEGNAIVGNAIVIGELYLLTFYNDIYRLISPQVSAWAIDGNASDIPESKLPYGVEDWAQDGNVDLVPDAKLPSGGVFFQSTTPTYTSPNLDVSLSGDPTFRDIFVFFPPANIGTDASVELTLSVNGGTARNLLFASTGDRVNESDVTALEPVFGYAGPQANYLLQPRGGGTGLDQAAVDARVTAGVEDWAETGDVSLIPESKLPTAATEGLNQGEVDARVAVGVADWAEEGDTSDIPASKLDNAPGLDQAAVDARVAAGVEDWAETGNASDIPDSKIPDGIARDGEVEDSFTGASETGGTLTLTRRSGSNAVDIGVGGGTGLTEAQVDARVAVGVLDWAEAGDTSDIPDTKIPDAIARDSEVADSFTGASETGGTLTLTRRSGTSPVDVSVGGGLDEAAVDARVAFGVLDWAETGNTDDVPPAKLPGSETYFVTTSYVAADDQIVMNSRVGDPTPQTFDEILFSVPGNIGSDTGSLTISLNGGSARPLVDNRSNALSANDLTPLQVSLLYVGASSFINLPTLAPDWATEGNADLVPTGKLGTGTADATTFLRGDGAWEIPVGGGLNESEVDTRVNLGLNDIYNRVTDQATDLQFQDVFIMADASNSFETMRVPYQTVREDIRATALSEIADWAEEGNTDVVPDAKRGEDGRYFICSTTHGGNTFALTTGFGLTSLQNGDRFYFRATATNANVSNANVDSIGDDEIRALNRQGNGDASLPNGYIVNDMHYILTWDAPDGHFRIEPVEMGTVVRKNSGNREFEIPDLDAGGVWHPDRIPGAIARLAAPDFTGASTAETPPAADDSTRIATTEWVNNNGGGTPPTHTEQYAALKSTNAFVAADFTGSNGVQFPAGSHTVDFPDPGAGQFYFAFARITTDPDPNFMDINSSGLNQFGALTRQAGTITIGTDTYNVWVSNNAFDGPSLAGSTAEFR